MIFYSLVMLQVPPPAAPSRVVQFVLGVVPSLIVCALVLLIADDDLSKFSVDRLHFSSRQWVYLCDARKQTFETQMCALYTHTQTILYICMIDCGGCVCVCVCVCVCIAFSSSRI